MHKRAHDGPDESRPGIRITRGMSVRSLVHGLSGQCDIVEFHHDSDTVVPIEYKRGKPKVEHWDRLQLCAQALCIEEMRDTKVEEGAIWYWEARKRQPVTIDDALRQETIAAIKQASAIRESGTTPPPTSEKKRCQGCSLYSLCEPNTFKEDWSARYIDSIGD